MKRVLIALLVIFLSTSCITTKVKELDNGAEAVTYTYYDWQEEDMLTMAEMRARKYGQYYFRFEDGDTVRSNVVLPAVANAFIGASNVVGAAYDGYRGADFSPEKPMMPSVGYENVKFTVFIFTHDEEFYEYLKYEYKKDLESMK